MTLVPELFVRRLNKPKGLPINVRDVSVTGDGQTDDYAALNEAVRSAGATGTLYFPAGTYRVGTNLTIPACCIFAFGAKLKPSSGVTVTLSGPVEMAPGESVIATGTAGTVSITGSIESGGGVLDVRAFGAVGDGVTDDTAAFNAASALGTSILVPPDTYRLDGPVNVRAGQTWAMTNATFVTASTTATMWECDKIDDWSLLGPFTIQGPGLAVGTFNGIRVTDGHRWRIAYPTFKSLSGRGLFVQNDLGAGTYRGDRGQVVCPTAIECDVGVYFNAGGGAEYNTVVAPNITGCNVGFYEVAGNTVCVGGSIVDNVIGVQMTGGANHCHGIFSGVNINHNSDHNIQATNVTFGHTFVGCHLYDGTGLIEFVNCKNIVLKDCYLTGTITNTTGANSGYNYIVDCHGPDTPIDITTAGSTELIVIGLRGPGSYDNNVSQSDPSSVYLEVVSGAAITQSLVSATPTTLTWGQITFDRRGGYAAGTFEIPTAQFGSYRIAGGLVFSGTAMNAADSYVEIRVNNVAKRIIGMTSLSTTRLSCTIDDVRYLNAGDDITLVANIVGTNPVFGDPIYESTLTIQRVDA
jgi:hypothetical protein